MDLCYLLLDVYSSIKILNKINQKNTSFFSNSFLFFSIPRYIVRKRNKYSTEKYSFKTYRSSHNGNNIKYIIY